MSDDNKNVPEPVIVEAGTIPLVTGRGIASQHIASTTYEYSQYLDVQFDSAETLFAHVNNHRFLDNSDHKAIWHIEVSNVLNFINDSVPFVTNTPKITYRLERSYNTYNYALYVRFAFIKVHNIKKTICTLVESHYHDVKNVDEKLKLLMTQIDDWFKSTKV